MTTSTASKIQSFLIDREDLAIIGRINCELASGVEVTSEQIMIHSASQLVDAFTGPDMLKMFAGLVDKSPKKFDSKTKGANRLIEAMINSTNIDVLSVKAEVKAEPKPEVITAVINEVKTEVKAEVTTEVIG